MGRLLVVKWLDAAGYVMEDLKDAKPCICTTVGWVKRVEADHVVLASSVYEKEEFGDFTVLPYGMIIDVNPAPKSEGCGCK